MIAAHILMAILATWRLTELMTMDRITDFIRRRKNVHYFWTCVRCVSVWASATCALLLYFAPYMNWVLGLSMTYLLYSGFSAHWNYRAQRVIRTYPDIQKIDWGSYDPQQGKKIMAEAFAIDVASLVANGGK